MIRRSFLVCILLILAVAVVASNSWGDKAVLLAADNGLDETTSIIQNSRMFVSADQIAKALGVNLSWDSSTNVLTITRNSDGSSSGEEVPITTIDNTLIYFPYFPSLPDPYYYNRPNIVYVNPQGDMVLLWDPVTKTFKWQAIVPPRPGALTRPPTIIYGPGRPASESTGKTVSPTNMLTVELVRVFPSRTNPRMVVRLNNRNVTYPVSRDAIILRGRVGGQASEVNLGDIRPGDRVSLRFNDNGEVISIRAQYKFVTGVVESVRDGIIYLGGGVTLRTIPQTRVILPENIRGTLGNVVVGSRVAASVSPISGRVYTIRILPSGAQGRSPNTETSQLELNTYGPLRVGDTLVVRFKAKSGGTARLDIPGIKANIPMSEAEPGVFEGTYTVKQGDLVPGMPIKVTFTARTGQVYTLQSLRPVTIRTTAGFLPQILYPHQGAQIDSPIVVKGIANPGSLVRVSIEYRRDIQRVLPIEGITALQDVRADSRGQWQTPPLPATAPFAETEPDLPFDVGIFTELFQLPEEPPTIYTVTATSIGDGGNEIATYSVDVTKFSGRALDRGVR